MKKLIGILLLIATAVSLFALTSCSRGNGNQNLWDSATYTEDTELGSGAKTISVEVVGNDKKVTFTIHTDKATLGEALLEHELIVGKDGLYTKVNGMTADYTIDMTYWMLYINGDMAMVGMDDAVISEGSVYKIEYTK